MNCEKIIYHVQPSELLRDGKNVVTPVGKKPPSDAKPLYILYYSEMFVNQVDQLNLKNQALH